MSRPASGRPQGSGLDTGAVQASPTTMEEEPRQGLLCAQVVSFTAVLRIHADPAPSSALELANAGGLSR